MAAVGHGNIPSRNSSKLSSSSTLWSSVEIEAFFPAKNNFKKMSAHKTSRMPHLNNNKKIKIKIKNSRKPGDSKYIFKKR